MEKQEPKAAPQWKRPQDIETFRTSDPKQMLNKYLAKAVYKEEVEDFIDEDSGDVQSITKKVLLFERGLPLDKERISSVMFYIQAGEIKDVLVTDTDISAERYICPSFAPFEVTLSVAGNKRMYLVRAQSVEQAIQIASDYASMYLTLKGWYSVSKVQSQGYYIVEDDDEAIPQGEDDVETTEKQYFNVGVQTREMVFETLEKCDETYIIKAHDVGQAKERVTQYLNRTMSKWLERDPNNSFAVMKAKPYETAGIVPRSYSELYFEKTDY